METEKEFEAEELVSDLAIEISESKDPDKKQVARKLLELVTAFRVENPDMLDDVYVVGCWLWYESKEKPNDEQIVFLKALGFRWNAIRKLWQHSCGVRRKKSNGDPRITYGKHNPEELLVTSFPTFSRASK